MKPLFQRCSTYETSFPTVLNVERVVNIYKMVNIQRTNTCAYVVDYKTQSTDSKTLKV